MDTTTILLLILSVFVAAGLSFFQYLFQAKNKSNLNLFLAFLRFVSFFGIFILLINPKITSQTLEIEKTPLVLVMDNSSSISFFNAQKQALTSFQKLISNSSLQQKYAVESYQFDSELKMSNSFNFKGTQTNLDAVAQGLKKNYKNKTFPTVIFTDGNQTSGSEYDYSFNPSNKIYPIVLGDTTQVLDLKINQINVNKYAFYRNKFPVEIFVSYSGDQEIAANLGIQKGKSIIAQQTFSVSPTKNNATIQMLLPADQIGLQSYTVQVKSTHREKNSFNNTKYFSMEVLDQKTDIAIVSAINHPDIGALKRAIESHAQRKISLVKPNDISTLKKSKLVIFYQPTADFKNAFETTKAARLNSFIITGTSTDFKFLNQQQTDLVFQMTNQTEDYFADLNLKFPLFHFENSDFESFPPLQNSFGSISAKNNISVLLYSKSRSAASPSPLLAFSENQGKRAAYLLGENSWKWRSQSYRNHQSFEQYDAFIDAIIQFLAADSGGKALVVDHESFYNSGDPIKIKAQYYTKNYELDQNAKLTIAVVNSKTKVSTKYDFLKDGNSYAADLEGFPAGAYDFTVTEMNSKERYSGRFEILAFEIEKQFVNADLARLKQLAAQTNGTLYFPDKTDQLIQALLQNEDYKAIQKKTNTRRPLIEWTGLLLLISAALGSEWLIRKYNGLL